MTVLKDIEILTFDIAENFSGEMHILFGNLQDDTVRDKITMTRMAHTGY